MQTNPPSPVEEIAGRLSEAEKAAHYALNMDHPIAARRYRMRDRANRKLRFLTPFGKQVRDHLRATLTQGTDHG